MRVKQGPTPAELAVLGIVSEGEVHGYGIDAIIEERGMRCWTAIGFSSIYAILQRLEKAGLVEGREDTSGGLPARKTYRVSRKGRFALKKAAKQFLTEPERPPHRVCLGMVNLHLLSKHEAIESLEEYSTELRNSIDQLTRTRDDQAPIPFTAEAIFDHSLCHARTELEWAEEMVRKLKFNPEEDLEWVKDT
jgi:DNA-binding PadR family transcriptional regulator